MKIPKTSKYGKTAKYDIHDIDSIVSVNLDIVKLTNYVKMVILTWFLELCQNGHFDMSSHRVSDESHESDSSIWNIDVSLHVIFYLYFYRDNLF